MKNSSIEWTNHTFNPWIGCTKVSPGCAHCYAETINLRWGKDLWGKDKERQRTSKAYWTQPLKWDEEAGAAGVRKRVFCASMADVFDSAISWSWRNDLFALIGQTKNLDWLLLTKRPEMASNFWAERTFMPDNIWLGVSVEDQKRAQERIPILLQIPARIRFLSVEPMLGPVSILDALDNGNDIDALAGWDSIPEGLGLHWVICGGESGPKSRPIDIHWCAWLRDECKAMGWSFFMKQLGGYPNKRHNIDEFPEALQIREFPK